VGFLFGNRSGLTQDSVLNALRSVVDPDLNKDIVTLGFVRDLSISRGDVSFELRLTTPACPVKDVLREQCVSAVRALDGVSNVTVRVTAKTSSRTAVDDKLSASMGGVRNIIAVASGKGGVGKSSCTVNLAYGLAAAGARVGLLDADVYGPSVQHMTGVGMPGGKRGALVDPPSIDGIVMLSMAMFMPADRATLMRGPRISSIVQQFLTAFRWGELDYLLIDYPPGTGDVQITLAQLLPITGAVLVTTPQEVALIDVRRAHAMFRTLDIPVLGVLETMSGFLCPACDVLQPIFSEGGGLRVAQEFDVPLLGQIPLDPLVVAGADEGCPVIKSRPDAPASRAFVATVGALAAAVSVSNANIV
jgi:ATP-binding protein involved in chromosome partitioning